MDDSNSIIDLGKLAEPATVLVQKISDAIGGAFKPWQIVRVAEAQAKADRNIAGRGINSAGIGDVVAKWARLDTFEVLGAVRHPVVNV